MTVHGRHELIWKNNVLFYKDRQMARVYADDRYKEMFHIEWHDKSVSDDFYNLTRAKDHAVSFCLKELNEREEEILNTQETPPNSSQTGLK